MHCDFSENGADAHDLLELSRVVCLLPATSPNLEHLSFRDTRERPKHEPCLGISVLLGKLRHLRHFTCSMTMEKQNLVHLAAMPNLSHMSIAMHTDLNQCPALPTAPLSYVPFRSLETMVLDVKFLEHATACVSALEAQTLRKFRLTTPMWQDEAVLEKCFKAISKQRHIRELTVCVVPRPSGFILQPTPNIQECGMSTHSISSLFALPKVQILSLNAEDNARFETDLDDTGIIAMANAWPNLRSLTIVQGSWAPRGVSLPHARTTMGSLLALRDHCPDLAGLSISLDTTSFDKAILHAAYISGSLGTSLRKLNIGSRSTPVSNHSFAAQVLHGLFPNLRTIHDGESVAWDRQSTDWQEVSTILRKLTRTPSAVTLDGVDDEDILDQIDENE